MDLFKIRYCFVLFLCTLILGFCYSNVQGMELSISGQTITLNANNIPLRSILNRINAMGIIVEVDPQINPLITADFRNKNIQDVLNSIIGENSHALVWEKDDQGQHELSKIIIHRRSRQGTNLSSTSADLEIEKDPHNGSIYVKNKILLQFQPPVDFDQIQAILDRLKASIKLLHKALGLYEITLPEGSSMPQVLAIFSKVPGVGTAEPDYAYNAPDPVQYETDYQLSQDQTTDHPSESSPVAIIDSGLNPDFLSRDLNFASLDALAPGESISDTAGHGTQMALIASGQVAPLGYENETFSNPVLSIRAFDDNGYTSNTILIKGIDFAIEHNAKVLSLSWGSETDSAFLKQAMTYARSKGLTIVAAAGNTPTGKPVYPSAYDTVICVSALAPDGKSWDKSNYGDFVDVPAPGFAKLPIGYKGDPGTYAGTSISTAYVAGKIAAYLRENPGKKIVTGKLSK